ncbi:MAG: 50S ribosomal protein L32 [bacterium]|nr:50S ribosomal protein L32 [bacterium]
MANPKRRQSRSRRDKRRANWKLTEPNYTKCPKCSALIQPHKVCSSCGFYNGEIAVIMKDKSKKTSAVTKASVATTTAKDSTE